MTIATKNGTDVVAETEQQEQPQAEAPKQEPQAPVVNPLVKRMQEDKEFLLHLSLPDTWTEEHYTCFSMAESAAIAKGVDPVLARYYGVLALFRAKHVRVIDLPKLQMLLSKEDAEQKFVPLEVKGAMIRAVANPLDASVNMPFLDFLKG